MGEALYVVHVLIAGQAALHRLPEQIGIGRAWGLDEKLRLIRTAKSRPEWDNARLAMMLAFNSTMRGCELRGLRWRDVNLIGRTLTIRRSKTDAGQRVIPVNADAMAAILELRERSRAESGDNLSRDWYVFPHAEGFTRPDQAYVRLEFGMGPFDARSGIAGLEVPRS